MTSVQLSVLIPHKHTPANDQALAIALSCLAANTHADFEIMVDAETPADPYVVLNSMAERARGGYLFFSNSDIFVSPGWDSDLLARAAHDTIVNATLVEPGAIGVFVDNMTRDFGMTPEKFRRAEFEEWAAHLDLTDYPGGTGFVYYALIHRETFLARGGFDTSRGPFPEPLDSYFWKEWKKDGLRIERAYSLVYHLQNYSNEEEQAKAVRHA
jgi:hypothetical protein